MGNSPLLPEDLEMARILGIDQLPAIDQIELLKETKTHLQNIILETVISALNDTELSDFRNATEGPDEFMEERVEAIAARVPRLYDKIVSAVDTELQIIKQAQRLAL